MALLEQTEEIKGLNKAFVAGVVIAVVVLALAIWLLTLQPSMDEQMQNILAGSFTESSPEFASLTRDIIISTDPNTVQSPNAFGKISMFISGKIRNKGTRTINGLEVNVAVVDQFNQVIKEKRVLVVPTQRPLLGPDEIIPITLSLDGFDKKDDRAYIRWKVTAIRTADG
ncbi:MAG: hypothetical protein ABI539_13950 [Acidobacteriota bacterium]